MQLCSAVMRIALLLAVILATPVFASQYVWKWVDAQGVTHYADRPVPGAQRVQVTSGTTSSSPQSSTPAPASSPTPTASRSQAQEPAPAYRTLEIWKPSNDQTFQNQQVVEVSVRVEPDLKSQHTLSLYLDGKLVEGYGPSTQEFALRDVVRGTHQVIAVITDPNGERLMQSAPVVFHMQRTTILNPQQGGQRRTGR